MCGQQKRAISKFREALHGIDNLYNTYAKSVGLNFEAILILELLYDSEVKYTQKGICEKLGLPKQLVNSIIKVLWEKDYVELIEAKDRRIKEIFLVEKGKEYAEVILKPLHNLEYKVWESFSSKEITNFAETIEKYRASFELALANTEIQ